MKSFSKFFVLFAAICVMVFSLTAFADTEEPVFVLDFDGAATGDVNQYEKADTLGAVSNFPNQDVALMLHTTNAAAGTIDEETDNLYFSMQDCTASYVGLQLFNIGGGDNYLPIADKGIYTITYDVRFADGAVADQIFVRLNESNLDGTTNSADFYQSNVAPSNSSEWQNVTHILDTSKADTPWENGAGLIEFYVRLTTGGSVEYDNIQIYYEPFAAAAPEEPAKSHELYAPEVEAFIADGELTVSFELIENDPGFAGMTFYVEYDDTVLDATGFDMGLGGGWTVSFSRKPDQNPIKFTSAGLENDDGTGELVAVTFDILDTITQDTVTYVTLTPEAGSTFYYAGEYLDEEADFTLEEVSVKVTILDAIPQDIAVEDVTLTYGDEDFAIDVFYGENVNEDAVTTFISNDEEVVTVSDDGTITVVGAGETTITVYREGSSKFLDYEGEINVTVAPKTITVTADSHEISLNDPIPELTYTYEGELVGEDAFTGELYTQADGHTADLFDIEQGTLTLGDNYEIDFCSGFVNVMGADLAVFPDVDYCFTGSTFEAYFRIVNNPGFAGAKFKIYFDTDVLELVNIREGDFQTSAGFTRFETSPVTLDIFNVELKDKEGVINYLDFKVKEDAPCGNTEITVECEEIWYFDQDGIKHYFDLYSSGAVVDIPENVEQEITVEDYYSATYGDEEFTIDVNYGDNYCQGAITTFLSDNADVVTVNAEGVVTIHGAGEAQITVKRSGGSGYLDFEQVIDVEILKRSVTVEADDVTIYQGQRVPVLTYVITDGFLAGDDEFTGKLSTLATGEYAGTFPISQGTLELNEDNYNLSFVSGTVTVLEKLYQDITVVETTYYKTYGDDAFVIEVEYGEEINEDASTIFGGTNFEVVSVSALDGRAIIKGAGEAEITVTRAGNEKYYEFEETITVYVDPKTVYVKADSHTIKMNQELPLLSYVYEKTELVGNDTFEGELETDANVHRVGTYAVDIGTLTLGDNYEIDFEEGQIEVVGPELKVSGVNYVLDRGDILEVVIDIKNNPGFAGLGYEVEYDEDYLVPVSCELGIGASSCTTSMTNNIETNPIAFVYAASSNIIGDGMLATIKFKVADFAPEGETVVKVVPTEASQFYFNRENPTEEMDYPLSAVSTSVAVGGLDAITLSISPEKDSVIKGKEIKFDVTLDNIDLGVGIMTYYVNYDKTLLELTNIETLAGTPTVTPVATADGRVAFVYAGLENITTDGVIATLTFTALDVEEETYANVSIEKGADDEFVCYTGKNADVETEIACNVAEASGVTVKACLPGDANSDGTVNNRDAARVLQYVAQWDVEIDLDAADANGDGTVNNRDAARILQYVAQWDVTLG